MCCSDPWRAVGEFSKFKKLYSEKKQVNLCTVIQSYVDGNHSYQNYMCMMFLVLETGEDRGGKVSSLHSRWLNEPLLYFLNLTLDHVLLLINLFQIYRNCDQMESCLKNQFIAE